MESTRPHIVQAINLIKSNAALLIVPCLVIGASYLSVLFPEGFGGILALGSLLATLLVYPLMYGRFTEIITVLGTALTAALVEFHFGKHRLACSLVHLASDQLFFRVGGRHRY
jgi:hypothetical protein